MHVSTIPLPKRLRRGARAPRIALVGLHRTGKETIFDAVSATEVKRGQLPGSAAEYTESQVEVGLEQARVVLLPHLDTLDDGAAGSRAVLSYLLWGERPPEGFATAAGRAVGEDAAPPDVLIQVIDATALERNLELTLELTQLGRPLVVALNRLDEVRARGLYINVRALEQALGVPVVATVAHMGKGVPQLFEAAMRAASEMHCPLPQPPEAYLQARLADIAELLSRPDIEAAVQVARPLLTLKAAEGDAFFVEALAARFPELPTALAQVRALASEGLPRPLADELHADRHHRCARLFEMVTRIGGDSSPNRWKRSLDQIFLHPRWGLVGSLGIFALVLLVVFEVSTYVDSVSSAPLGAWVAEWQPHSTVGVVGRAVADGMVGLLGIVVPYMLPLVMLLVALEESGIMHRVAFVVDRGFHAVGLHGGVALPFLLGLGCNVPAISAAAQASQGRERIVSALLITFVPCSARSAILLALGGKYLGGLGVFALFMLTMVVIALAGRLLSRSLPAPGPGLIQEIPPYAWPNPRTLLATTWERTSDILTIVTPLLVVGSVVLALLSHWGADQVINTLLTPVSSWWLGLPAVLGVPILFGVLRKELSLLMIYQALGTLDIAPLMNIVQIATFLAFLTFYVPCLSTFAVMLKKIGAPAAFASVGLSVVVALVVAGAVRAGMSVIALVG